LGGGTEACGLTVNLSRIVGVVIHATQVRGDRQTLRISEKDLKPMDPRRTRARDAAGSAHAITVRDRRSQGSVGARPADHAQNAAAEHSLAGSVGVMQFGLDGTGTSWVAAGRGTRALSGRLALEFGALVSRYEGRGGRATLLAPEAQIHYYWLIGACVRTPAAASAFATQAGAGDSDTEVVLAGTGGVRIPIADRVSVLGEFRLRGYGIDFAGTTADWMAGCLEARRLTGPGEAGLHRSLTR
jgi:hypothetical protein